MGYVRSSIDTIITLRVEEELEKYKFNNDNPGSIKAYEELLQKAEQQIRSLNSTELQLKIQCHKYSEKIDELENDKNILLIQIVSN